MARFARPADLHPARWLAFGIAFGIGAYCSNAPALESDRTQVLNVDAAQLHADPKRDLTLLTGDVRLTQGSIKADGDKATVYQDANHRIVRVVLVGAPAHFQQQLDNNGGLMHGRATNIDYHANTDVVDLDGDVFVVQENRGEFRGRHLVYNTATGEMQGGGEQPGGRVHLRMLPKQQATPKKGATPAKDAAKPAAQQKKPPDKQGA
ncbi:MAG: lipopolysaccharide transport periplasmic protein LptA [Rhodanobacteraceae bacterium]